MSNPRVLVAGIGNLYFGDDGFGIEVVRSLARRRLPEGVDVVDYGARDPDLAYALFNDYDMVILVNAHPADEAPRTLYILEIEPDVGGDHTALMVDPDDANPKQVLTAPQVSAAATKTMLLLGCEPEPARDDDLSMQLSAALEAAVPVAVDMIEKIIANLGCIWRSSAPMNSLRPAYSRDSNAVQHAFAGAGANNHS